MSSIRHRHHDHDPDHDHDHPPSSDQAGGALRQALVISVAFMALELAGGIYANSLALTGDAFHMLTDVGAVLLSFFALWVSRRPASSSMTWGYHRAEILGALASGLAIWGIAAALVYGSVVRLQSPPEVHGSVVFWIALAGLAANLWSMAVMHGVQAHNLNVRGAYLHLLADSLGSVGAVIAGAVLWATGWRLIDPIVTILFAVLMLLSSWQLVREAVEVLMESAPRKVDTAKLRADLCAIPAVQAVHDLHVWTVGSGRLALSVHLVTGEAARVMRLASILARESHGIGHVTIQIDPPGAREAGLPECEDCEQTG